MSARERSQDGILHAHFGAPTPAASLQILITIGRALQPRLLELAELEEEDAPNWSEIVRMLARTLPEHLKASVRGEQLETVWNAFFATNLVSTLPEDTARVLREVRAAAATPMSVDECVDWLVNANMTGYSFARDLLREQDLGVSAGSTAADLSIIWDPDAAYFCASATRLDRRIRWAHQPVESAVYAALLPEFVFAHEYLSHLSPLNPRLSRAVTEVWLVAALKFGLIEPAPEAAWQNQVWEFLRGELSGAGRSRSVTEEVRRSGLFGVDLVAMRLHARSEEAFWRLTRLILTRPRRSDAEEVDELLSRIIKVKQGWARIGDANWHSWNELQRVIE